MALYDVELTSDGRLRTYPNTAPYELQMDLQLVAGRTPISLVISLTDYRRLMRLFKSPKCLITDDARERISIALESGAKVARPLTEPTEYELFGYVEEVKQLTCIKDVFIPADDDFCGLELTAGKKYEFVSKKMQYKESFTKTKYTYSEADGLGSRVHEMQFDGHDYALEFQDDREFPRTKRNGQKIIEKQTLRFREHPTLNNEMSAERIWEYFKKPEIPTLAAENKDKFDQAMSVLRFMESAGKFSFYPGQMKYIAQASCADSALISAETGCGKTLIAIALTMLKQPGRTLICAPKGTVKSKDNEMQAQWIREFAKFAPTVPVHRIFSREDYISLKMENGGQLPYGVFITYDHALFYSGFEHMPKSWYVSKKGEPSPDPEKKFREEMKRLGHKLPPLEDSLGNRDTTNYCQGVGTDELKQVQRLGQQTGETHSIRCIAKPCLATEMGLDTWDMVIMDEAHAVCNLDAQISKNFIRLQPKYKFALTATPIPNMVFNIFSLMGWLSVPNWYHGDKSNAFWPYRTSEIDGRNGFKGEFMTAEIDLTQAAMNADNGGIGPSCRKRSPRISQPEKLLKILRGKVAFISKEQCNPNLPKCNVMKVQVPMTEQQRKNYAHYMDPGNVVCKDPKFRYGIQLNILRSACANPATAKHNVFASSNYTPKIAAMLETAYKHISQGEQVLMVAARRDQLDELEARLADAKISTCVINGDIEDKAKEANDFIVGKAKVLLMSIKCAQALSFAQCRNLIIGSLEWSYGVFNQALGRVYRVNSERDINVYVMLHKNSVEDLMFDKLGMKEDAATIALRGERVEKDVMTVDKDTILAEHVLGYDNLNLDTEETEQEVEAGWSNLKDRLLTITRGEELGINDDDKDAVNELLEEMEDYA